MEKVRPWCGQPSDRGRLRNRTEQLHAFQTYDGASKFNSRSRDPDHTHLEVMCCYTSGSDTLENFLSKVAFEIG